MLFEEADYGERCPRGYESLSLFPDIATVLNRLNDRCPGRWSTDLELFEALDQRSLGVPGRRRCRVAVGRERLDRKDLTLCDGWEQRFFRVIGVVCSDVHRAIARERDRRTRCVELAVGLFVRRCRPKANADGGARRVGHL